MTDDPQTAAREYLRYLRECAAGAQANAVDCDEGSRLYWIGRAEVWRQVIYQFCKHFNIKE